MHPQDSLTIFHAFIFFLLYGSTSAQRRGLGRGGNQVVDFDCPEEFGYYPHPNDCTQYYVCVFGGALLESCTGGLMYSHELQTCDWPRNVGCEGSGGDSGTISTVKVTDPRTRTPPQLRSSVGQQSVQAQQPLRSSQRDEGIRIRQQQQQQQQIVYEDELGPAEEVESDRQQRVYRGQPSTLGQVQRDRDGLRPIKGAVLPPNNIPSGPGTVEKVSLVTYGGQRPKEPRQQDIYSDDDAFYGLSNVSLTVSNHLTSDSHTRSKRQAIYRLSGPGQDSGGQRTRKIPVILIPDKHPRPSYAVYGEPPHPQPTRSHPTSYSSQNNENYHVVHNYDRNAGLEGHGSHYQPISYPHQASHDRPRPNKQPQRPSYEAQLRPSYEPQRPFFDPQLTSYDTKLPRPPPHRQYHQSRPVVHIGYEHPDSFNPQELFFPATNKSRPNHDLDKLTKETIQTAFRPMHSSDQFTPEMHRYQEPPSSADFFKTFMMSSKPPQSTTPQSVFLEAATRTPPVRLSSRPKGSITNHRPDPITTTVQYTSTTSRYSSQGPTRVPLFEPANSKRKRKKSTTTSTTTPMPTTDFDPTLSLLDLNLTYLFNEPEFYSTLPTQPPLPASLFKNDHRFYVPPASTPLTEKAPLTTLTPPTTTRRKPPRQRVTTSTTSAPPQRSTPKKQHISEEFYENFKPLPTNAPSSTTYGKRQKYRPKPTMPTTSANDDKMTTMTVTRTFTRTPMKNVRVEPEQEIVATTPATPVRYNTTARYQPNQYDPYYPNYQQQQQPDIFRGNQYHQETPVAQQQILPQPQQQQYTPSSTARSPVQQYRGQSTYKQQQLQEEPQQDTYSDIYGDTASQDYTDQDEQQYQQLASPKPSRSTEAAPEPARKDTLSEPSIDRPLVTNQTVRRSDSFDPSILAPPPQSPSLFLTPPNEQQATYYLQQLEKNRFKETLQPPKNGGAIAKSINDFGNVFSSFLNQVQQSQKAESAKVAPQTFLRSEVGHIRHDPVVQTTPKPSVKPLPAYQELPDRDIHTFFVEIEPKRPKQPNGFLITRQPPSAVKFPQDEPAVEITREMLVNPESKEVTAPERQASAGQAGRREQPIYNGELNILPLRAPSARFNPYIEEIEFQNQHRARLLTSTTTQRPTTSTTPATTTTTTQRPRPRVTSPAPKQDSSPYQFIIVSTEVPTPFTRNPDNENRGNHRFTTVPRSRNPFSDFLAKTGGENYEKPVSVLKTEQPKSGDRFSSRYNTESPVKYNSKEAEYSGEDVSVEVLPSVTQTTPNPRTTLNSSTEDFEESNEDEPIPRLPGTVRPSSAERARYNSQEIPSRIKSTKVDSSERFRDSSVRGEPLPRGRIPAPSAVTENARDATSVIPREPIRVPNAQRTRYRANSGETTENSASFERGKYYSSEEEIEPIRSHELTEVSTSLPSTTTSAPTTTTRRSSIRIRTTTDSDAEPKKQGRKVVKLHRGELSNQRINPKVKKVRRPSTQSPIIMEEKSSHNENDVFSTVKPIIVDDLGAGKNVSRLRFTVEDDEDFVDQPKRLNDELYIISVTAASPQREEQEKRVVRPAYQPINLDILESAEEPIESRPSTEPPSSTPKPRTTTPTRNPDHDRATAKPSRGRSSLKPRLKSTTVSPDSLPLITQSPTIRQRGGSPYHQGVSNDITSNRATPAPSRGTRPTLKPSTSIVSQAAEFIDIYKYPPRRPENLYATPIPDKSAAKCRKDVCLLPDCSCGGKEIPGGLSPEETPQIVLLTFDDSVNDLNKGLYADLFERGRVNPNGCPISATFYVSHEWTDYSQVQNLYANGHEIASHSVSHSFGEQFSQKKWTREISGQREILSAYGGVRLEDIRGMRAPFLAVGGNKMFKMLHDSNFTYDSSMPIYENKPPSWPYTLDYKLFHDCMIPPCPTKSYPGVWEVPMVMWQDLNGGRCSMGDACSNPPTADGVYKMLIKNFERHFTSNRAPFGLFYHAAWFTHEHHKEGFIAFLDTIVNMPEVWLVNNWQAIQWVRDPQPLSSVNNFAPFQCNEKKAKICNNPKVCNLWHKSGVRYMRTCQPCPEVYPWTGKSGVRNSRVDNEIIDE